MQPPKHGDVVAAVINFNTAGLTAKCVRSLLDSGIRRVLVLDNASGADDYASLRSTMPAAGESARVIRSEENLGFAQGSNYLIDEALRDPECQRVLLLNSDAVASAAGMQACLTAMRESGHDLMGGRMMKPAPAGEAATTVDSLGMSIYKSLLASNRMSTEDTYLGPTGGFTIFARRFLEEVKRLHGYVYDPAYFCYAEDTDLCVRARLLGAAVGYSDETVAFHVGQGSHAAGRDEFILYHGIRNSIWMAAKSIPGWVLVTKLPWFLALHAGIVVRHTLQGRFGTVVRLYVDAIRGLPRVLAERGPVQASRRVPLAAFRTHIDPHFYETAFLAGAIRDLFRRPQARR